MSRTQSTPGIHVPLRPRTVRCEQVWYFQIFIGHGAVQSEFLTIFRSWCGAVRKLRENGYQNDRYRGPEFLKFRWKYKSVSSSVFNYRIFNLFIWDNLKLFFVSVFSVCWRTSENNGWNIFNQTWYSLIHSTCVPFSIRTGHKDVNMTIHCYIWYSHYSVETNLSRAL